MPLTVAEYIGLNARQSSKILPAFSKDTPCPFCGDKCTKIRRNLKPVCSVRREDGLIWVVCTNRLVAANRDHASHELKLLVRDLATVIFPNVLEKHINYANQRSTAVFGGMRVNLDYILYCSDPAPIMRRKVILEIQAGGETSDTGNISRHVSAWESDDHRTNAQLAKPVRAGVIPNNAWKRQLEQVLRKASYAYRMNACFALAMGELLYAYVDQIVQDGHSNSYDGWEVCFIELREANPNEKEAAARFTVGRCKFMSHEAFIAAIAAFPIMPNVTNLFEGKYTSLLSQPYVLQHDPDPAVEERKPRVDLPSAEPNDSLFSQTSIVEEDESAI